MAKDCWHVLTDEERKAVAGAFMRDTACRMVARAEGKYSRANGLGSPPVSKSTGDSWPRLVVREKLQSPIPANQVLHMKSPSHFTNASPWDHSPVCRIRPHAGSGAAPKEKVFLSLHGKLVSRCNGRRSLMGANNTMTMFDSLLWASSGQHQGTLSAWHRCFLAKKILSPKVITENKDNRIFLPCWDVKINVETVRWSLGTEWVSETFNLKLPKGCLGWMWLSPHLKTVTFLKENAGNPLPLADVLFPF